METKKTKATNSFSHDSNARNSEKIIKLRMRHGAAGYGIYFMILERLRECDGFVSVKDYNILAFDLRVDAALVKSVVENFGLFVFTPDGKYFYSEELKRQLEQKDEVRKKRQEIGKAAMEKRWAKKEEETPDSTTDTTQKETATRKRRKPKATAEPETTVADTPPKQAIPPMTTEQEVEQLKTDSIWLDNLQVIHHIDTPQLRLRLDDFLKECRASGKLYHDSIADAKHHFNSWLRITQKLKADNNDKTTATAKRRGNQLHADASKTKDYGSSF